MNRCGLWIAALMVGACSPPTPLDDLPQAGPLSMAAPPDLSVSDLLPGHPGFLTATANPGERVFFVTGTGLGPGICPAPLNGECLDVTRARLAGSAVADISGVAIFEYDVANSAAVGSVVAFQPVVLNPTMAIGDALEVTIAAPGDLCQRSGLGSWPDTDADMECEMLILTNEARALGQDCGTAGVKPPTHPLTMNRYLRDAARTHGVWMQQTGSFGHSSPGGPLGDSVSERASQAGYRWRKISENVARGRNDAGNTLDDWINSSGHCRNLMNSDFVDAGYGRSRSNTVATHWVGMYGKPR